MMGGSPKKNRPDDLKGTWINIFRYIRKYRYLFVFAVVLSAIGSILALFGPYLISDLTDLIKEGIEGDMDMDEVKRVAAFLFGLYLASGLIHFLENYMMATVSQRCAQMFRRDITRKFNLIPLRYFDRTSKGDVMSRVTNDADTLGTSMNQCIGSIVTAVTALVGGVRLYKRGYRKLTEDWIPEGKDKIEEAIRVRQRRRWLKKHGQHE